MPQTNLTPSQRQQVTRWLAEKVMGWAIVQQSVWHRFPQEGVLVDCSEAQQAYFFAEKRCSATQKFDPLDSWADTGKVWEKAQADPQIIADMEQEVFEQAHAVEMGAATLEWFLQNANPLALSMAIFKATGGVLNEGKDATQSK